jgi:pyruvate,water dikinase
MDDAIIAKGRPASPGTTAGIVKVVNKVEDLSKVEYGDILVVKYSNPAWTVGMVRAGALISETGGVISHAAIVAREMGLPCIVAVENATTIFKDGQRVKVDGTEGLIYEH